jgi:hypothetical protein
MNLRGGFLAGIAVLTLGCGEVVAPVTVSVQAPNRQGEVVPIPGAELTLLPFDIDSVYAALEEKNQAGPQPSSDAVESLYQAFYQADTSLISADSLVAERQRGLEGISDRASPEYREAFAAYQRAQDRRDSLATAEDSTEARYVPAREAYNRARGTWEAAAWDGFGPISEQFYSGVAPPRDSVGEELGFKHRTGEDGTFTVNLAEGRWWVAGRVAVPGSPHEVYRWNVPITVEGDPERVELTGDNAKTILTY